MNNSFSGSAIDKSLYEWIVDNLDPGKTILEFGSGKGSTMNLSKHFKMISIEHDIKWIGKYNSKYIWAPIIKEYNWYDINIIKKHISKLKYDMILVDGPVGEGNRNGFLENLDMFDIDDKDIIIDDISRKGEMDLFINLIKKLKRKHIKQDKWGVLLK